MDSVDLYLAQMRVGLWADVEDVVAEARLINPDVSTEAAEEESLLGGSCEPSTGAFVEVWKEATLHSFVGKNMMVHFFLGMNQDGQGKY